MSDWKVELTALGLADGHTSITVPIDYGADANAAAKWRLAGGAHGKMLLFKAAGKGRGGVGIWHMIDGLSIASEACLDLWQGSACGAWPPKPRAHWSICYLHPQMDGAQLWWESMRALQEESWGLLPLRCHFRAVIGQRVSSQRNIVNHEGAYERWLLVNSRQA